MKILYFDCSMGSAGDMLAGSLFSLLEDSEKEEFLKKINNAGLPGVKINAENSIKRGISGVCYNVTVNGSEEDENEYGYDSEEHDGEHEQNDEHERKHHHSSFNDIENTVNNLNLDEKIKKDIISVYSSLAEAESKVHGEKIEKIHLHEVGAADAIADIASVSLLLDILSPDKIISSPVNTGFGRVKCAHGVLPVPAPATAELLKGIPVFAGDIEGELCTPTGAALLRYYSDDFGKAPPMTIERTGYGMGKRDYPAANCLRSVFGEYYNKDSDKKPEKNENENSEITEKIYEVSCNIDDMTAEDISFAVEKLFECGALDVFITPVIMKKSRPGALITALCKDEKEKDIARCFFKYTSTLGVREKKVKRRVLTRKTVVEDTPLGRVRKKISEGWGVTKEKYEFDDIAAIADKDDLS